ncbi:MAG: hypothetical protein U9R25_00045 [Chloroflexota bacterium]|nr:hypothetical protein [Chloroflexota bacterium]
MTTVSNWQDCHGLFPHLLFRSCTALQTPALQQDYLLTSLPLHYRQANPIPQPSFPSTLQDC